MTTDELNLPDTDELTAVLRRDASPKAADVRVIRRRPNPYASTFMGEILTCEFDGEPAEVLCKYGLHQKTGFQGPIGKAHTNQKAVEYEAEVYRRVLASCPVPVPRYYGSHLTPSGTWLFIEFLEHAKRSFELQNRVGMEKAASWLGMFHKWGAELLKCSRTSWMVQYDQDFFARWVERAVKFDAGNHQWLRPLGDRALEILPEVLARDLVVVHGEFYPQNVLINKDRAYVVDWESAAVGGAAIDLAALLEKWPVDDVNAMRTKYEQARWPDSVSEGHEESLKFAGLYWQIRWLGASPEWTSHPSSNWRFQAMLTAGNELGLL